MARHHRTSNEHNVVESTDNFREAAAHMKWINPIPSVRFIKCCSPEISHKPPLGVHSRLARRQISRDLIRANAWPEVGRDRKRCPWRRREPTVVCCYINQSASRGTTQNDASASSTSECRIIAISLFLFLLLTVPRWVILARRCDWNHWA